MNPGTLCNTAETQAVLMTFYDEQWALIPVGTPLADLEVEVENLTFLQNLSSVILSSSNLINPIH